jgi:hypothetical protein
MLIAGNTYIYASAPMGQYTSHSIIGSMKAILFNSDLLRCTHDMITPKYFPSLE